jgi:transposase
MDVTCYPLVCLPPEPGTLVPVSSAQVVSFDSPYQSEPDRLAFLWQCFCKLAWFLFLAAVILRQLRQQLVELRLQANYWRALHQRAVQREAQLKEQNHHLQGEIRDLKRRLFSRKSETSATAKPPVKASIQNTSRRSRGQQRGSKGHGRRSYAHLPTTHEPCTLPSDQRCCPACGEAFEEIAGSADGDILEVEVRAHRRRYHRQRYRRRCQCPQQPAMITAPPPDKLIAKSPLGISVWVMILQHKFEFFQPLHRVLAELRSADLPLSAGTVTGGLQKLVPLFQPLYELLVEHNRGEGHWHCDETRWLVFVKRADKAGFGWMLWVFAAKESIVFVLDPTRSHDVPEGHLGTTAEGIASVDRYSAYKAMAQVKAGQIILAFCWAHVRRDFLVVLTSWPELTEWAWSWVEEIGTLYHRNDQRLAVSEDATAYAEADRLLRLQVEHMRERCDTELAWPNLRRPQHKVLTSLHNHWSGLTVFVAHPEVPMDNNRAERCERGPVVARKNFYGSGSLWSGRLAAMLFSLFQTVQLWGLDVGMWLTAYLTACAKNKGHPPAALQFYLPWNMTPQEREQLSRVKQGQSDP